jgi:hypothetical protein
MPTPKPGMEVVKGLGGIGIDRSQKNDLVNFVANNLPKKISVL